MRNLDIKDMIIYEDGEILVCHKQPGFAVQNARFGTMDMESALKNYLAAKNPGKMPYLGIVHRLDQPVEGAVVFAKTQAAAKELSRQFASGETSKKYLAVTSHVADAFEEAVLRENAADADRNSGQTANVEILLEDFLLKDGKSNSSRVVPAGTTGAKKARLSCRILQEIPDERTISKKRFLVQIHLETGRHHQIRVQMSHAGMPLLGDRKYNAEETTALPLGLCSCELAFRHPKTKKMMRFQVVPKGETFAGFVSPEI